MSIRTRQWNPLEMKRVSSCVRRQLTICYAGLHWLELQSSWVNRDNLQTVCLACHWCWIEKL